MNGREMAKTNQIHTTIRFFQEMFPVEFEKTSIKACSKCFGTGFEKKGGQYNFDGPACSKCKGIGYLGYTRMEGKDNVVCMNCNGRGCEICKYQGIFDWVNCIMRPDLRLKAKEEETVKEILNLESIDQF